MNIKSIGTKALLALAGSVLLVPASSEAALTHNDGDLLLGFRATGGTGVTTSYLVNLGSIAQFLAADANDTILTLDTEIGNIGADLTTIYGGSWQNRVDLLWSVTGVQLVGGNGLANKTLLASRASFAGAQGSTGWLRPSAFNGIPSQQLSVEATKYEAGTDGTGQTESTNSLFALIQPNAMPNNHASFQAEPGSPAAYDYFVNGSLGVENTFEAGTGPGGTALDFYFMQPGSGTGEYLGQFTLSNTGTVTFTPEGVPEPSTALALAGGALVLASLRRRNLAHR
jgi:hypothetical protein